MVQSIVYHTFFTFKKRNMAERFSNSTQVKTANSTTKTANCTKHLATILLFTIVKYNQ